MSDKITFSELVEKISAKTDQSEQNTNDFIHELAEIIESSLGTGEKISISGFGKFELRWIDERKGRNPQTGEEITIPGQNKVVFKPYKALRERVNKPFKNLESQVIGDEPKSGQSAAKAPVLSYSAKTIPTSESTSGAEEKPEEDLLIERDSPVEGQIQFKPKKKQYKSSVASTDDEENLAWVFEKKMQHQNELAKDVQSNGSYKWSYTAAAVIVLLAIFLFVFLLNNQEETLAPETTSFASQSAVEQVDNTPNTGTENLPGSTVEESVDSESDALPEPSNASQNDITAADTYETVTYPVSEGESLWTIARDQYGDPYLWPLIYEANQNVLDNPNVLAAGNSLQLPDLDEEGILSEEERKMVALGYISVYDWILENQPDNARFYLWAAGSFSQEVLRDASENVNEADLAFATQG